MTLPIVLTLVCLLAVAALVQAEWVQAEWVQAGRTGGAAARVVSKLAASTAFVLLALQFEPMQSAYGQWMLAALVLGWLGDALLLGERAPLFLAGLAAFLWSHLCFALAFVAHGVSLPTLVTAGLAATGVGWVVLRWLWPHVPRGMKPAVTVYVVVILLMCACAASHSAGSGHWQVLAGATLFAASDLAVARDRFVAKGFVNKLWGLPTYYVAQLVLAWTLVFHLRPNA